MFKILTVKGSVRVPPAKFGQDINAAIKQSLQEQVEGKLDPEVGVFLAVTEILNVAGGDILPEDGAIYYQAEFKALAYVPEVNEVVMGEVVDVAEFGAFARIGPIDGLIHVSQVMDDKVAYNPKMFTFTGKKNNLKLKQGDLVRARIASVSLGKGGRSKIALTMRQPILGAMEWIEKAKKAKPEKPERHEKKEKK
jgi:DNA-directed RNA polymerase subunit E'